MAPANPRATLPARTNQTTPGSALWNVTSPVRPDPIPRARHARATTERLAHTLLALSLIRTAGNSTHNTLHHTATCTRLGARPAAARPTGSPVGLGPWRPALMMLGAPSTTCSPCIDGAGRRYLQTVTRVRRLSQAQPTEKTDQLTAHREGSDQTPRSTVHKHTRYLQTHSHNHSFAKRQMQGSSQSPCSGQRTADGREGDSDRLHTHTLPAPGKDMYRHVTISNKAIRVMDSCNSTNNSNKETTVRGNSAINSVIDKKLIRKRQLVVTATSSIVGLTDSMVRLTLKIIHRLTPPRVTTK